MLIKSCYLFFSKYVASLHWAVLVFGCVKSCGWCHFISLFFWQFSLLNMSWWDHKYKRCTVLLAGMLLPREKRKNNMYVPWFTCIIFFYLLVSLISIILLLWEGCCSWFDNFMFADQPVCLNSYIQTLLFEYCECICVLWSLSAFWLAMNIFKNY